MVDARQVEAECQRQISGGEPAADSSPDKAGCAICSYEKIGFVLVLTRRQDPRAILPGDSQTSLRKQPCSRALGRLANGRVESHARKDVNGMLELQVGGRSVRRH